MAVESSSNPYPGLRPFETEEDYLFFGRDGQSEEILGRLRRNRLVAVVGTSGSGKSSLIRAGLLPYVFGGFMAGAGSHWRVAVMRPAGDPVRNLVKALDDPTVLARPERTSDEAQEDATLLEVTLRRSGLGLIEAVRQAQLPATDNILLVVDQFEELFRFADPSFSTRNEDDAAAFVKLLLEAVAQTSLSIYVVLTMRSDFIGDCARYRDLPEAVAAGLYLIPRMTRDQRREAIGRPARVAESAISPRLMNRLLNDGGDNPDLLPILQHALMRTWDYWHRHRSPDTQVDLDDYKAIGEMEEALSLHAEEAYAELPDDRGRMIAKRMFQGLTEKGADNREIRRPTSVATIAATAEATVLEVVAVIDIFRKPGRSFLTPLANVKLTSSSIIDISHESLIRGWHRLNKWVDDETESTKVYLRLAETAALEAKHKAALWRGSDLTSALAWREQEHPNAAWGLSYHPGFDTAMRFLERSAAARRQKVVGFTALAACLIAATFFQYTAHQRNLKDRAQAQSDKKEQETARSNEAKLAQAEHDRQDALIAKEEAEGRQAETQMQQSQQETEWVRQVARSADAQGIETNSSVESLASTLGGLESPDQKAGTLADRGEALSKMGQHEQAAQAFTNALLIQPAQFTLLDARGYEYILMGRADDALKDLNTYLEHDPHSSNALLNRAIAFGMLKRYKEAEADTGNAIASFQFKSSGMFDSEVSPDIKRATGQSTVLATPVTFRVALYYEMASLKAFAGDPGFLAALHKADRFAQTEGFYVPDGRAATRPAGATVDPFVEAIEWAWLSARAQGITSTSRSSTDYGVYAAYGALWERAGRIQPRFTDWSGHFYQVFQQTYDNHRQARYASMNTWVQDSMAALYPGNTLPPPVPDEVIDANFLADNAKVLEDQSKYADSAEVLTRAIQDVEHRPEQHAQLIYLLMRRARMYNKEKNWAAAISDCKQVIRLAPKTAEAYDYLGLSETDNDARIRDFTQAERLSPTDWTAKYYLALAVEDKDPRKAVRLLKEANQVSSPASYVYREIAKIQNSTGDYSDALASVNASLAMDPNNDDAYTIRDKAEQGLGVDDVERTLDRAAEARLRGDYLARTGSPKDALRIELQALLQLALDTAGKSNVSTRAEETVAAYNISQLLQRLGSRQDAKQFWTTVNSSAYYKPIADIAQREVVRLTQPQ